MFQQLAELPKNKNCQIYILGLLHQSFADYGERLASVQRNEWAKIQGRFEDIPFKDSDTQMMSLIGQAIDSSKAEPFFDKIQDQVSDWFEYLPSEITNDIAKSIFTNAYPLHPIATLVLPKLCTRYAQNDRSLFTFLTSAEPYSFQNYLEEATVEEITVEEINALSGSILPTLKLDRVYDYFIEAVGLGLASRPNLQRWVEIQTLINDAKSLEEDSLRVLKTIGILNLVTTTSPLRATRTLVTLAMCDFATDDNKALWEQEIDNLLQKGILTYRRQLDELRIWQGSDFNVDIELSKYLEQERSHLVNLLSDLRPLSPLVVQRHSYTKGTLRYFERRYLDGREKLNGLQCTNSDCDGLVGYWVDNKLPDAVPSETADGKPLIILAAVKLDLLQIRAKEFAALKKIQTNAIELQTDGVARQEVRYRLIQAEELLDEMLAISFDVATYKNPCWVLGKSETISHIKDFNAKLSDVCDQVYSFSLTLWNELINRRELTSQGSKARRELIEAMLEHPEEEILGLSGYGPEVSMYYSVLNETGIHRQQDDVWGFYPPNENSGVSTIWQVIEEFCFSAKDKQKTLDHLYTQLAAPPYGIKQGVIPVLLAAVLLYHVDDVGVYKEGTFIPVLGIEHFELLLKDHSRFSVKYFEIVGLRSQVFKELEMILRSPNAQKLVGIRNTTLLAVVRPLFQFVKKLPAYTKKTKRFSPEGLAVLQTLQKAQEPDELLFNSLPKACGLPPIMVNAEVDEVNNEGDGTIAKTLRKKLVTALHEIQTAYDRLLAECQSLLHSAFAVRSDEHRLREDLRVRASYLSGQCIEPRIKSFVNAATNETSVDSEWLEALVMIVADRPAESWTDEDVTNFEVKLSDLARRFKNLEAIQKDAQTHTKEGFEARKITVTRPDGQETHSLVWFDHENKTKIQDITKKLLGILNEYEPRLWQAVVTELTEQVMRVTPSDGVAQQREKRQKGKDEQKTS